MIEIDRDKLRFFHGAYCGDEPNRRFVKAVWREDYRGKPLVAGGRAITPIADMARWFDSGSNRSAGDFESLASHMLSRWQHQVARNAFRLDLETTSLRELFLPEPFGTAASGSVVKALRFRQFDGEVRRGKEQERGSLSFSDSVSLEAYEFTFSMLIESALYGEPQIVSTGLAMFDPWFNELLEGLAELKLPETQIREKLYRSEMVRLLQREYSVSTGTVNALKRLCETTPLTTVTGPEMYLRAIGQGRKRA